MPSRYNLLGKYLSVEKQNADLSNCVHCRSLVCEIHLNNLSERKDIGNILLLIKVIKWCFQNYLLLK